MEVIKQKEVFTLRQPARFQSRVTGVLWAKADRQTEYTYKDKWQIKRVDTYLYYDEDCTLPVAKLARSCPRILKSGVYSVTNYPHKYCYINVVDNGVRRAEKKEEKYVYNYKP